jgi:hypothetical protein
MRSWGQSSRMVSKKKEIFVRLIGMRRFRPKRSSALEPLETVYEDPLSSPFVSGVPMVSTFDCCDFKQYKPLAGRALRR